MIYVEWLRARHRLAIVAGALLALVLIVIAMVYFGHIHAGSNGDFNIGFQGNPSQDRDPLARDALHNMFRDTAMPLGAFFVLGAFVATFFTTTLYTSLHAQRSSLDLAFTKPLARFRLAATLFAVDFAAIAACYAVAVILFLLPFAVFGLADRVVPDAGAVLDLVLGFGICVLLYGLVQLATAWLRGGAIAIIGTLWVAFIVVASIQHARITNIEMILRVLRPLDPIRYFGLLTYSSSGVHPHDLTAPIFLAWGLGLAACALAAFAWQRIEV